MTTFEKAYETTLGHEGGYVDDPNDRGGETYKGISRRFFRDWEGWVIIDRVKKDGMVISELNRQLEEIGVLQNHVKYFYKTKFWDRFIGDDIKDELVAMELFDTSINMGVGSAVKMFQRALNALNNNQKLYRNIAVDGGCGPKTIATFNSYMSTRRDSALLVKLMNIIQGYKYIQLMEADETQERFVGWFERVQFNARRSK